MAETGRLSPKQQNAIAALLIARDVRAAAKTAKIGERTLHRWLAEPSFQAALQAAERDALHLGVRRLTGAMQHAIDTLLVVMANKENAASTRVRAADVVLSRLMHLKELAELQARVTHLEEIVAAETNR